MRATLPRNRSDRCILCACAYPTWDWRDKPHQSSAPSWENRIQYVELLLRTLHEPQKPWKEGEQKKLRWYRKAICCNIIILVGVGARVWRKGGGGDEEGMRALHFHFQVKKAVHFSQPFKEKCLSEVVRIGSIIIFHLWVSLKSHEYCVMLYFWWGCRGNLNWSQKCAWCSQASYLNKEMDCACYVCSYVSSWCETNKKRGRVNQS